MSDSEGRTPLHEAAWFAGQSGVAAAAGHEAASLVECSDSSSHDGGSGSSSSTILRSTLTSLTIPCMLLDWSEDLLRADDRLGFTALAYVRSPVMHDAWSRLMDWRRDVWWPMGGGPARSAQEWADTLYRTQQHPGQPAAQQPHETGSSCSLASFLQSLLIRWQEERLLGTPITSSRDDTGGAEQRRGETDGGCGDRSAVQPAYWPPPASSTRPNASMTAPPDAAHHPGHHGGITHSLYASSGVSKKSSSSSDENSSSASAAHIAMAAPYQHHDQSPPTAQSLSAASALANAKASCASSGGKRGRKISSAATVTTAAGTTWQSSTSGASNGTSRPRSEGYAAPAELTAAAAQANSFA